MYRINSIFPKVDVIILIIVSFQFESSKMLVIMELISC